MIKVSKQKWKEINGRKAQRYSRLGRQMEVDIAAFLSEATKDGVKLFERVVRHLPGGYADRGGSDITIYRNINGDIQKKSFGITISQQRFNETRNKHEGVPVFYTPIGFNRERLLSKIMDLFD